MSDVDSDGTASAATARPRRVAPFIALAVAIVLAGLFVVLAGSSTGGVDQAQSFLVGRPAPRVVSTTLDDQPFDLSRRKGSWVVLNFFDPTCVPCVEEHPELIAFADQQAGLADGAELYTIINRGNPESVQAFFDANGGDWPIVRDPDGGVSVDFGVAKVPETWIIDPNGVVRARYPGAITAERVAQDLQAFREGRA
ncbi:MAG: TlpA disulfide reductase family protein [Actinobacteria bacterium]|nr:TlpA disulfide reductase family protein [Actinomycetota bacterium]